MCLSPSSSTLFPYTTLFRSLADNIALGGKDVTRSDVETAIETLGLTDWVASFAEGLDTPVGQRGEQLSAGERSEEQTSELQSRGNLVCYLLLDKKNTNANFY